VKRIVGAFATGLVAVVALGTASPAMAATYRPAVRTTKAATSRDRAGDWEMVLGHRRTAKGADTLKARAEAKGLHAMVERAGRNDFQVEVDGFKTAADARKDCPNVRKMGFGCSTEKS
jgi:invasion protein IalB